MNYLNDDVYDRVLEINKVVSLGGLRYHFQNCGPG